MKVIIVDDELASRAIITQLCSKVQDIDIVGEFENALDAIKFLNKKKTVDLIFLDVNMPGFSGFDFIETIKNPPKIILTTSHKDYAVDAFEYPCIVDYLTKPISEERFLKAVEKVRPSSKLEKVTTNSANDLFVNIERRLVKIKFSDINLIQAKGDYISIKTQAKNYIVYSTLKKILEKLPENLFVKVHRSYIINMSKIIDIEDNSVLIEKEVIPISRANKDTLIHRLNLL